MMRRPLDELPTEDAAARRQEILDRARRKSERATQEIFSSSYGSKWGGYAAEDLAQNSDMDSNRDTPIQ